MKIKNKYNTKASNARKYYKAPMYFYYLAKLMTIKDMTGKVLPELQEWYNFCNLKKKESIKK